MQAAAILPMRTDVRIFIGGCATISFVQIATSVAIMWTMQKIAGNVIPPDAAEAYAAGYAVGAVRGEQRQGDRRAFRRGRAANRSRERREGNGDAG